MSETTAIEWTDTTWNPVRGCTKVSPGCANCYAETFAERWRGVPGHAYEQGFDLRLVPHKLGEPQGWKTPRRVFVNSMSDLFQDGVPDEYIAEVWKAMATIRRHTYQVLTKRPERMHALMPRLVATFGMLPNVWLGVSVENQRFLERIDQLKDTPAAVHFVSFEPLLDDLGALILDGIEWAIVGGESGPCARPCAMEWISSVVDECRVNKVPCFVKQLGAYVVSEGRTCDPQMCRFPERALLAPNGEAWAWRAELKHPKGGNPDEWPADLRVREFPKVCQ